MQSLAVAILVKRTLRATLKIDLCSLMACHDVRRMFRWEAEGAAASCDHLESTPEELQSFTTVKSLFLWAQLIGDPLQALLNSSGVEVDDHPRVLVALSEVIEKMQLRGGSHLPSLLRRFKEPKRWWPGGGSLDSHWSTCGKQVFITP